MIKEYVKNLMKKLDFPITAQNELFSILELLLQEPEFLNIVNRYKDSSCDFDKMLDDTKLLAESKNICVYTAHMLLLLCMSHSLQIKYEQKGIDINVFYDTMRDLNYKLEECRLVHNKCGTFVAKWYKGFFEMRIFSMGRLQFEINHTWFDCEVNGVKIPKGTKILSVHIPRSGIRLDHNLVINSYNKAIEFFKEEFEGNTIFICNSWLLYPWNRTVFKDNSNLALFYDDFTIVETGEYSNYNETWRLFDCLYDDNIDKLPYDTTLRQAYVDRMKLGLPLGYATGVIIK